MVAKKKTAAKKKKATITKGGSVKKAAPVKAARHVVDGSVAQTAGQKDGSIG